MDIGGRESQECHQDLHLCFVRGDPGFSAKMKVLKTFLIFLDSGNFGGTVDNSS